MFDEARGWVKKIRLLLPKLTVASSAMIGLLIIFGVVLFTLWENKDTLSKVLSQRSSTPTSNHAFTVSGQTASNIQRFLGSQKEVITIMVWAADASVNNRLLVYWHTNDIAVRTSLSSIDSKHFSGIRLFNNEEKNDAQIVRLMNGEWVCLKTDSTVYTTIAPDLVPRVPVMCRTSLPPYYGDFSGYIEIGMWAQLHPSQMEEIKAQVVRISNTIFTQDLLPSQRGR
jgi:hypothetical protein